MKAKPVLDRIILKQSEGQEKVGVLIVPENAKEKPKRGVVVAVGSGAIGNDGNFIPMMSKVGDEVIYSEFSGATINIDGEEFVIVREAELLVIL